jgi:phosphate transport system permease protein
VLGAVTYVTFNPDGVLSRYTVLPIQIYTYIGEAQTAYTELAAAAIVLLLGIVILMNSIAILLRNKYQKRW